MEKIANGTYMNFLVDDEMQRRQTGYIGNGIKLADGSDSARIVDIGKKVLEVEEQAVQPPKPPRR